MNILHGWNLVALIVLVAAVLFLGGVSAWWLRQMWLLRLDREYLAGERSGFRRGRDFGYDAGVDDARRGIEYVYDWEGNEIDAPGNQQAASGDPQPGDRGMVDTAGVTIPAFGPDHPAERTAIDARPDGGRVPDDQAGDPAPDHGQAAAPALLAVQTSEGTFWAADALELHASPDVELADAGRYFAGIRAAIGDPEWPDRELQVWRDGYEQGADDEAASFAPDVFSLLGDTDAFGAIHTAFNSLWTDVVEPPFTLTPWRAVR